jgi:hypothetical protein
MLGSDDRLQNASTPVRQPADGAGLVIGEITEAQNMPLGFDHQIAAVRDQTTHRMDVTDVHEVILIHDATLRPVTLLVLLADEADILVRSHSRQSVSGEKIGAPIGLNDCRITQ